jgi:plastocyanin
MRRHIRLLVASIPLVAVLGLAAAGAAAGGGCHAENEAYPSEAKTAVVKIDGCTFAPTVDRIPVGGEVRWINSSESMHDVTGRRFEWGSGELWPGKSYTHRFATAGVYPYSCSLHPGMAGVVVVGSPDVSLASDVQNAPIEPVGATGDSGQDATMSILSAGGLGLLGGALFAGAIVSRRKRAD